MYLYASKYNRIYLKEDLAEKLEFDFTNILDIKFK